MIEVCNEEISIQYNGKTKTYKNYLLSNFLNKFVQKNFGADDNFGMTVIYGVFNDDAEIPINNNTSFEVPDFDNLDEIVPLNAYKYYSNYNVINTETSTMYNQNEVTHIYRYKIYKIENDILKAQNSAYFGEKISYLLFGNLSEIYAILDIRDENIIYNSTANVDIFRRDKITTTGKFVSSDITYPYHLSCFMANSNNSVITTEIKNIDLAYNYKQMSRIFPINKLSVNVSNNKILIMSDALIEDTENSIYPQITRFPRSNKYPMPHIIHDVFNDNVLPFMNIYAGDDLFPAEGDYRLRNSKSKARLTQPMKNQMLYNKYPLKRVGNYKYVIIEYELNSNNNVIGHYKMAYPIEFNGKIKISIEYERREY